VVLVYNKLGVAFGSLKFSPLESNTEKEDTNALMKGQKRMIPRKDFLPKTPLGQDILPILEKILPLSEYSPTLGKL
jgi:hypothetical protein